MCRSHFSKSSKHTPWIPPFTLFKRNRNQLTQLWKRKSNLLIRFVVILIGCACIAILPAVAENYTGDFLTNGVGGRALGLGGAYVSIADDTTAAYWNPAGIASVTDKYQLCLMHAARRSGLGRVQLRQRHHENSPETQPRNCPGFEQVWMIFRSIRSFQPLTQT